LLNSELSLDIGFSLFLKLEDSVEEPIMNIWSSRSYLTLI